MGLGKCKLYIDRTQASVHKIIGIIVIIVITSLKTNSKFEKSKFKSKITKRSLKNFTEEAWNNCLSKSIVHANVYAMLEIIHAISYSFS